jgi:glycine dehydrogenase subunit 2
VSTLNDNVLHADPGIETRAAPHDRDPALQSAAQREPVLTIFEKGAPGRRAFACPELDVDRVDGLLPERFRRTEPTSTSTPASTRSARAR